MSRHCGKKAGGVFTGRRVIFVSLALIISMGCAPVVSLQVQRTPNWNTAGIRRVAVMPFEHDHSRIEREIAQYLTTMAITNIKRTNHFTLISDGEVSRLRRMGESVENHVDALFSGRILNISVRDSSFIGQVYDPDIKQMIDVTYHTRDVELTVSYSLELVRDGSLVGIATRTGRASDKQLNRGSLKSESQLLQECRVFRSLARDIAPYTAIEQRALMSEKSKDKALREKMKNAQAQVRQNNYRSALNAFLKIYDEYTNVAAAYNASIMHEALGDSEAAVAILERAADDTGNPTVKNEIARLNRRIEEERVVDAEYRDAARPIDRVTAHASSEALAVLPPNARVWLVIKDRNEQALTKSIADAMSSTLISNGITVVDRDNTQLIEQEQIFQMSGSVNDDDLVRAGYLAGANIIITVSISGVGSMRRLQLRVLDVEKGTPLLQSGTGGQWEV